MDNMDMKTTLGPIESTTMGPMHHGNGGGNVGMDMDKMDMDMGGMDMKMYFHTGYENYILFEKWIAKTDGAMFGVCVFFFVLAIVYESLKYYRQLHSAKVQSQLSPAVHVHEENGTVGSSTATQDSATSATDKMERPLHLHTRDSVVRPAIRRLSLPHLWQTGLHMLQMFVSYVLMLGFMSFNVWFCLAIVLGGGVGYFMVGSQKPNTYSAFDDDHCH